MHLDRDKVAELRARVEQEVERWGAASCQFALALDDEVLVSETVGDAANDARYFIWSSTKILAVAVVWQLIGEGALDPALPVTTWWPGFGKHGKDTITLEQVMAHSAGIPGGMVDPSAFADREARVQQIEAWPLQWEPGTRFEYHALSSHWVMAELLTRVTGLGHCEAIRARLLDPLGLSRLELGVPPERQGDIQPVVATGDRATMEEIEAELGPEITERLRPFLAPMLAAATAEGSEDPVLAPLTSPAGLTAGVPGGGGVSDAASVALLYQALLHNSKGLWDDAVLEHSRQTVLNRHPTFTGEPIMRGLGVEISGEGAPSERIRRIGSGATSPSAFGHNGAGGQIGWADPETGLSFAFLTNGFDRNVVRMLHRERAVNQLAAGCVGV